MTTHNHRRGPGGPTDPQPVDCGRCLASPDRFALLGGRYLMEARIMVDGNQTVFQGHRIAREVERCLIEGVAGVSQVIVHVDPSGDGRNMAEGEEPNPSPPEKT